MRPTNQRKGAFRACVRPEDVRPMMTSLYRLQAGDRPEHYDLHGRLLNRPFVCPARTEFPPGITGVPTDEAT